MCPCLYSDRNLPNLIAQWLKRCHYWSVIFSIKWRWHLPSFSHHHFTDFNLMFRLLLLYDWQARTPKILRIDYRLWSRNNTYLAFFTLEQKGCQLSPQKQKRNIESKNKISAFLNTPENAEWKLYFCRHLCISSASSQYSSFHPF